MTINSRNTYFSYTLLVITQLFAWLFFGSIQFFTDNSIICRKVRKTKLSESDSVLRIFDATSKETSRRMRRQQTNDEEAKTDKWRNERVAYTLRTKLRLWGATRRSTAKSPISKPMRAKAKTEAKAIGKVTNTKAKKSKRVNAKAKQRNV